MPTYTRPDTYAEEVQQLEGPVQATATGLGGMQAVTQKGPPGVPIRTRSFPAWKKIFGDREAASRGDAAYEAKAFFDEGGFELITSRQVHYGDIDDPDSFTGGVASATSLTDGVDATSASKQGGVGPFNLAPGDGFALDVDNAGAAPITFNATEGSITDNTTYPVADQDGLTLQFQIDGGDIQTVTFAGATTLASEVISQINAVMVGGRIEDSGGQVKMTSDTKGTGSTVAIVGGTSTLTWAAASDGTGDVVNIDAVTTAEVKTQVEAATTATVALNTDGSFTVTSPTAGASSELDFGVGAALAILGLSIEVIVGTDAGATFNTLKLEAGYHGRVSPGLAGNNLSKKVVQNPLHPSQGAGSDLAADATSGDAVLQLVTLDGLNEKSVIKISEGANTEYFEILAARAEVVSGAVQFYVDLVGTLTNSYTAAGAVLQSMEFDIEVYENSTLVETHEGLSMLDTADNYVETILNDENLGSVYVVATDLDASPGLGADTPATDASAVDLASGTDETLGLVNTDWIGTAVGATGLYAWDTVREFMPLCTVGNNEAPVMHAAAQYCESRIWMEYLGFVDIGMSSTDAIAFRKNILGINSSYMSLYAGGIKVYDPAGAGSNPQRSISGMGALMGLRARVDTLSSPNGGPWQAPAGEGEYGTLRSALNVATEYKDTQHGNMNVAGINVLRKFGNSNPVVVWGARTLENTPAKQFLYIPTRRFFQYAEKSIVDSTRWAVFRNNDFRLWGKLKNAVSTWLRSLMPDGAYPTPVAELAFYVKSGITDGVMDSGDVDNGHVISEIGIAPNKPGEFIRFRFTQFDSGWDVVEE